VLLLSTTAKQSTTELIWFGSKKIFGKVPESEWTTNTGHAQYNSASEIGSAISRSSTGLRVSDESTRSPTAISISCILSEQLRLLVGQEVTVQLLSAFVFS